VGAVKRNRVLRAVQGIASSSRPILLLVEGGVTKRRAPRLAARLGLDLDPRVRRLLEEPIMQATWNAACGSKSSGAVRLWGALFVVEPGFPGPRRTRSVPYPYAEWSRLPTQLQV
jgi:hypothetical protein